MISVKVVSSTNLWRRQPAVRSFIRIRKINGPVANSYAPP